MQIISLHHQVIHTGHLIPVNPQHSYYEPETADFAAVSEFDSNNQTNHHAAVLPTELASKINGRKQIVSISGWRSFQGLQATWVLSLAKTGFEFDRKYTAIPSHSKHQTGLTIDLNSWMDAIDRLYPAYPYRDVTQTFRQYGAECGFIVKRYPNCFFMKIAQNQQALLKRHTQTPYSVSGNHINGFIFTEQRKFNE